MSRPCATIKMNCFKMNKGPINSPFSPSIWDELRGEDSKALVYESKTKRNDQKSVVDAFISSPGGGLLEHKMVN